MRDSRSSKKKMAAYIGLNVALFFVTANVKAQTNVASQPLSAEITHRIEVEIRDRYSISPAIELTLSSPKSSNVSGYDQFTVKLKNDSRETSYEFLVSKDRKTLARLETMDISEDIMSKVDLEGRPARGTPGAPVTVVVFQDFECPYSSRFHPTLFEGLLHDFPGKIRILYKDYPLAEIHPWAMHAAVDANCLLAQDQPSYWTFADYVYGNQRAITGKSPAEAFGNLDKFVLDLAEKNQLNVPTLKACIQTQDSSSIKKSIAEGDRIGVDSTPMAFINGEKVSGAIPLDQLHMVVNHALAAIH